MKNNLSSMVEISDLRSIIEDHLNIPFSSLFIRQDILKDKMDEIIKIIEKRKKGIPLEYVIKKSYFWDFEIKVIPGVFIPRPETEILIELVEKLYSNGKPPERILDIGSGTGVISIALKKIFPGSKVYAVDISQRAAKLTANNAKKLNLTLFALQGNLLEPFKENKFDIIASNPPYIPSEEIENLPLEVKYEPKPALDGGDDGLIFYRILFKEIGKYLRQDGKFIFEINPLLKDKILKLCPYPCKLYKDYSGNWRIIAGEK